MSMDEALRNLIRTIEIGPLETEYHRQEVDEEFLAALGRFIEQKILPQAEEPYSSTEGSLVPPFNEERYCGPNSAVRNIYSLKLTLVRKSGSDEFKGDIRFKDGAFQMRRRHESPILWTARLKKEETDFRVGLQNLVKRVLKNEETGGEKTEWHCPRCEKVLGLVLSPHIFDLSCANGCFTYNFHRHPETKEFLHGHMYSKPLHIAIEYDG